MSGFFYRLRPDDFRLRTLYGAPDGSTLADWPIAYADLEPYYDEIERRIGVSGDAAQLPHPQTAFPLPPISQHAASRLVDEAAKKRGHAVFQTPRAIISGAYGGRQGCHYCGFCASYGCEVGAKSSTLAALLPAAERTGKLTLVAGAMALAVETAADGRASAVVWTDGKARRRAAGRAIVVAAGAIQSARLLLASGIANQSGQLGKNLVFAGQGQASGRFALPHAAFSDANGGMREFPFLDRTIADYYITRDTRFAHPKAGVILFLLPHINPVFQAEQAAARGDAPPRWGRALTRRLRETFRESRRIEVETFAEFFPHAGCAVTLDDATDVHGQRIARITASVPRATRRATELLVTAGEEVLTAAGATVERGPPSPNLYWFLQAGTTRMAARAGEGVVGADGQAFDVRNLYIADGGPLVSGGGAPFTLTIMANALRVARGIAARATRREL